MALQHAKPGQVVTLSTSTSGRSTALVKTDGFEAIRLVIASGAEIPAHRVPGRLTLQCLDGRVEVGLVGQAVTMRAGDWLHLDGGASHSVKGLDDSVLLLTIVLQSNDATSDTAARAPQEPEFHDYSQCGCVDRWEAEGGIVVSSS